MINLGNGELVTIDQLVDIVEQFGNIQLKRNYNLSAPKGGNGRNSDNIKIKQYLDWKSSVRLKDAIAKTYEWIESEMSALAAKSALKENKKGREPCSVGFWAAMNVRGIRMRLFKTFSNAWTWHIPKGCF